MALNETQKKERSDYLERNLKITECSQRKPYAFISYASDNWEAVFKQAVVPLQRQYGLCVYADKAFDKVNDKWIVPMLRNVRGADLMIAFVSQSYIESYACFLELLTAVNNKKQIIFVSLEDKLYFGDTTDQPNIERGVKNEILNQGANIATNTNNTSNDLMRAMKSAYTSISTLLEQDALSKYDISDAFINFFRDASINRKTINDLKAVRSTIKSLSRDVFDTSLIGANEAHAETASAGQSVSETDAVETAGQEPEAAVQEMSEAVPQPAAQERHIEPAFTIDDAAGRKGKRRNGKFKAILFAGIGCVAAAVIAVIVVGVMPKSVKDKAYEFDVIEDAQKVTYTGTYTGEWKSGGPNGQGTYTYANEEVYEGEWADGLPNGQGTKSYADGRSYEGEWKSGRPNGQGIAIYADGETYEGEFVDGRFNGQGTLTNPDGRVWTGEFKDGKLNGQAVFTNAEGARCEGEYEDGSLNGQAVYSYANGDHYEGEFVDSDREGQGTMIYANGNQYEGEWKDGKKEGQGTMTYANGDRYEGEWKSDKKEGQGTFNYSGENQYVGEWKADYPNGRGSISYANGNHYEGEFVDSKREGQGTMIFANGDQYEGEWKDDNLNGQGTMIYADGKKYEGEWKDGYPNGWGVGTRADGTIEEGEFKNGKLVQ